MNLPIPNILQKAVAKLQARFQRNAIKPERPPPGKRPFRRYDGMLFDCYAGADGTPFGAQMPASILGEKMPEQKRQSMIRRLGGRFRHFLGHDDTYAICALTGEKSKEYIDGLLRSLKAGDIMAPWKLAKFREDPRVQPALLEATLKVPATDLANFAQALGTVGGPGAKEVLQKRFDELKANPHLWDDAKFFNDAACNLQSVIDALLKLDPGAEEAVKILLGFSRHPCQHNRERALASIAELQEKDLPERTALLLSPGLAADLADDAPEIVLRTANIRYRKDPAALLRRLEEILESPEEKLRSRVIQFFIIMELGKQEQVQQILLRHLPRETSPQNAQQIISLLGPLAPIGHVVSIIKMALGDDAPSCRFFGIMTALEHGDAEGIRTVFQESLAEEPDPQLRILLAGYLECNGTTTEFFERYLKLPKENVVTGG